KRVWLPQTFDLFRNPGSTWIRSARTKTRWDCKAEHRGSLLPLACSCSCTPPSCKVHLEFLGRRRPNGILLILRRIAGSRRRGSLVQTWRDRVAAASLASFVLG